MPLNKIVQIKIGKDSEKVGIICVKSNESRAFLSTKSLQ